MIIYKAINIINGKYYIGKTKNSLESRIKSHKTASGKKDWLFYRAINKYGFDKFKWEILIECDNLDELNELEKRYISENVDGYNIAKGGNGGDTISNNPNIEKIKENVSKFHKGKILSDEHKEKISNSHKGKIKNWAKETAKKMSENNVGKESKLKGTTLKEEHKEKISNSNKGKNKTFTEEHKKAISKSKEGFVNPNKGKTYEEIMGAEKALELKKQQSEMRRGRVVSEETKKKLSEYYKNKKKMETKELAIVKYIKKYGLEKAIHDFNLKSRDYSSKILLKYDQLSSPTLMAMKEVQECRGLILEKGTWKVMSLAFTKFFNSEEGNAHKIDWDTAHVLEKLDGSLIQVYYDWNKKEWFAATTGTAEGEGEVNNKLGTTFNQLFWTTLKDKYNIDTSYLGEGYTYVFELTTPYNIVVKPHGESSATLLTMRKLDTLEEVTFEGLTQIAGSLGVPRVKSYDLNAKNIGALLRTFENMVWHDEGYVIVDGNFNRVKVKNPAYVAVHHLKGKTAEYNILTIIKSNEIDEFAATFPDRKDELYKLKENYDKLTAELNDTWEELKLRKPKNISAPERKKYAQAVFEVCTRRNLKNFTGLYFGLMEGKIPSVEEFMFNYDDKTLYKIL